MRTVHRGLWLLVVVFMAGCATNGGVSRSTSPGGSGDKPTAPVASATGASLPAPTAASSSGGTPTGGPTVTSPGTVTVADAGYTVRLSRGEQLSVYLSNQDGAWDPPEANGEAVQRTEATGGYPSGESARATFMAVADGTATIVSRTDHPCLHANPPCAIMQRFWQVRVIVSG